MRGNEFLDKMGLINPAYVEAANINIRKSNKKNWLNRAAIAACLCIIAGAITMIPLFNTILKEPKHGVITLSDKTTAKVSYGYKKGTVDSAKDLLLYFSEEEMFAQEKMYIFRGRVCELANITIDFNGVKEARCIATIMIEKVYRGNIVAGEQITMLVPCAIGIGGGNAEDTSVIANLESGTEGIFMPLIYDDESYMEQNGAKLMLRDIASCGLADGMRWVFLSADQGVIFERNSYPGAKNATDLDDIEEYVIEKLGQ